MPTTDLERRRGKRVKVQLPVRIDFNDSQGMASTNNVSLLGTCVNMDKQILPGTRVAVSLDIPKYTEDENLTGEVRGEGAVIRCEPSQQEGQAAGYELGIFFSSFLPAGEEKLSNYLDYAAKQEEQEVRKWVEQYRAHIKQRKAEIAKKKRILARKKQARIARRLKKLAEKTKRKVGRPPKNRQE